MLILPDSEILSAWDYKMNQNHQYSTSEAISLWLSKHYMVLFNLFVFIYFSLPIAAPVMMKVGLTAPASLIYRAYGLTCHQLAFRSWFLFGEQAAYPREAANIAGMNTFEQRIGLDSNDFIGARVFIGDEHIGYKIALCQRDMAIYGGLLAFGMIFSFTKNKIPPLPWALWIAIGILPIGADGLSQVISQLPIPQIQKILPYRESTPFLRTITGLLFGISTGWLAYPIVELSMRETKEHLLKRKEEQLHPPMVTKTMESEDKSYHAFS